MSNKKLDKGKFYQKLHYLQKLVSRLFKKQDNQEKKMLEVKEKHIIEKIKGKNKKQ